MKKNKKVQKKKSKTTTDSIYEFQIHNPKLVLYIFIFGLITALMIYWGLGFAMPNYLFN